MSLFIAHHPEGLLITTGTPPEGVIAAFPGLGKHLSKVQRHLPPRVTKDVYDVSPLVALAAVAQCIKPLSPCELGIAFRKCLIPVDQLNADHPDVIDCWAQDIFGYNFKPVLNKIGLVMFKKDEHTRAYKLMNGAKSIWVRVDPIEAWKVLQLATRDMHPVRLDPSSSP
jgi:hypothetical protein